MARHERHRKHGHRQVKTGRRCAACGRLMKKGSSRCQFEGGTAPVPERFRVKKAVR